MGATQTKVYDARYFAIASTDVSDALASCSVTQTTVLSPSVHTAGSEWAKGSVPTKKKTLTVTATLYTGDWASGSIVAQLRAAQDALTAFAVRQDDGAIAAANPELQFNASPPEVQMMTDELTGNQQCQVTLVASGDVVEDITP